MLFITVAATKVQLGSRETLGVQPSENDQQHCEYRARTVSAEYGVPQSQ